MNHFRKPTALKCICENNLRRCRKFKGKVKKTNWQEQVVHLARVWTKPTLLLMLWWRSCRKYCSELRKSFVYLPFYTLPERHRLSSSTLGGDLRYPSLKHTVILCSPKSSANRTCEQKTWNWMLIKPSNKIKHDTSWCICNEPWVLFCSVLRLKYSRN